MSEIEDRRLKLHDILVETLGSKYVYFQPPESLKLSYPCIVYSREGINSKYANNGKYTMLTKYSLTVIDKDPDSNVVERVLQLPMCDYSRNFVSDNLHHDVFTIYF